VALLKRKTRKALGKIIRKTVNKHAPDVAEHLATAAVAAIATYIGAEGKKKSGRKLAKAVKKIPGANALLKAISDADNGKAHNGHKRRRHAESSEKK